MAEELSFELQEGQIAADEEHFKSEHKETAGEGGYDYLAPDKSEIRLLPEVNGGGLCHCSLPVGQVSQAVCHRTVEELWFFLSGEGEVWRDDGSGGSAVIVSRGKAVNIPRGVQFQFRNTGVTPLRFIIATIPRWPGEEEAIAAKGPWSPSH